MKIIYQEFFCPECGINRWLRAENVCVDCRDKILLDKISQSRKMQNIFKKQMCV